MSRLGLVASLAACVSSIIAVSFSLIESAGGINLLDVAEWRPVFLIWGVCALVASLVLAFQFRKVPLRGTSSAEPVRRMPTAQKILLWVASLLVTISLAFPTLSSALQKAFERQWPATLSSNATNATIKVPLCCAGCAKTFEDLLRKETLAEKAEVNFQKGEAVVWFDPHQTSLPAIIQTLKSHGHSPEEAK